MYCVNDKSAELATDCFNYPTIPEVVKRGVSTKKGKRNK